ncbi:hypothetical protein V1477_004789 [Vespula maculifrons]|uniref:Uncharacterized protein n=1 Tax=Vespula maculifrons TaxID=7453 RepID=A0ABD2CNQ1_VESMC
MKKIAKTSPIVERRSEGDVVGDRVVMASSSLLPSKVDVADSDYTCHGSTARAKSCRVRDRYVDLERSSDDDDDDDDHHPSLRRSCKASTKMESKEYCGVAVSWLALLLPILSWLDWYAGRLLSIAETKRCPTYKPPFPLPREPIINLFVLSMDLKNL